MFTVKQYLSYLVLFVLVLLPFHSHSQLNDPGVSGSSSYLCARAYAGAFNSKNKNQLVQFVLRYYEDPDVKGKIQLEKILWKRWGRIDPVRIAYDSENETIMLMQASKMQGSYLIFDIRLKENTSDRIEFFTRTGINKMEDDNRIPTDQQILTIADRAVHVNDSIIQQTVRRIAAICDTVYYIPAAGRRISDTLLTNLNSGRYDRIIKAGPLADSIKKDMLECHFDHHSWVEANRLMLPRDLAGASLQNYGFEEFRIIDGNIGYVKLNEFSPSVTAREYARQVFDSLSDCKTMIFDLRDNYGGYPEMVELLSGYFFSVPAKINTLYDRNGNVADELWTADSIPGKRFDENVPVIILTSKSTASAAEAFTDFFKRMKRAVIIGEITNGARHPAKEIAVNPFFVVSVPFLREEESGSAEESGITPDISVPADNALEEAIEYAGQILDK
jgi:hypothetical protein